MNTTERKLPEKLSDCLALALEDLKAVELNPKYRVVMSNWHLPTPKGCEVCLAGAVMSQRLGALPTEMRSPAMDEHNDISPDDLNRLVAIDALRQGEIHRALSLVGERVVRGPELDAFVQKYSIRVDSDEAYHWKNPENFHRLFQEMVLDLKELGL